jgi:superfamily II DNA or RNA helicase
MNLAVGDLVRLAEADTRGELIGKVERVGRHQARVLFRRLPWTPPSVALPEMRDFPIEQLELCRDPWSDLANGRWSELEAVRLRVRCAELWVGNQHGQLGNARTDLLPHQVCLVHEVVERKRRRVLIAEEVGMGKTIETGMIIHALVQRRELERCLVVCPAGQISQWQEELEDKLRVRFEVYRQDLDGQRAFSYPRVIASLDTLKLDAPTKKLRGKSHLEILLEAPDWDLVVFDEAHRLTARDYGRKTEKTLNYRLAEQLSQRTRDFILLTGTPHDGNDGKFRNLLKALEPEVSFSRQQPGIFFGDLILKNRKSEVRDATGELLFKQVKVEKMSLAALDSGEAQFHSALTQYLREGYGVAEKDPADPRNRALGFVMITFQKLASSSAAAVRAALQKRLTRLRKTEAIAAPMESDVESSEDSRFVGEEEERTLEELQSKLLRDAFTASEVKMLQELLECPILAEAKWNELCRLINAGIQSNVSEKFLIFTEYRGTLSFIEKSLTQRHGEGSVATIQGGMGVEARREAMRRFRDDPVCRFLVSTEAGGEGINLQFCSVVVNYDLPWNPFRVIQRIGRVHRIGQQRDMRVFNYRLHNELDERLSECHEQRVESSVARLSEVTGLVPSDVRDQLLGFAQEFINYDRIFADSFAKASAKSSEDEISEGIRRAEEAFKVAYETVFKHAVAPFNPERFEKLVGGGLTLDALRQWLEAWLKAKGRRLMHREEEHLDEFLLPESLKYRFPAGERSVKGSFDRARAVRDPSVPLLAFGHPAIDTIARQAVSTDAGAFVATFQSPQGEPALDAIVVALLQTESHEGASAHQLLHIKRDPSGAWSVAAPSLMDRLSESEKHTVALTPKDLRESFEEFVQNQFPELDFVADQLHYVAVLLRSGHYHV